MIDLGKAFDMISHSILHKKLEAYGVRAGELCWFDSYLNGRSRKYCMGDVQSSWSDIKSGAPQGLILGPLLFSQFMNDLLNSVGHSRVKWYVS